MKVELFYYLKKKIDRTERNLISSVFKTDPVCITRPSREKIPEGSVVIIAHDCTEREKLIKELSERSVYVIAYTNEALTKPICVNKTLIISGDLSFNSLLDAIGILGIKKAKEKEKKRKRHTFCWGESHEMQRLRKTADKARKGDVSIHIHGETGSGKTLLADYLAGERQIVSLNCSCLDGSLVMDTLFGHVKGAYTGADSERHGLCRKADGHVLFLDELQDLPYQAQAMLLEVLENGMLRPLGADNEVKVQFKLITASSLSDEELSKKIRKDLLSRIGIIKLKIPPLRERKEDIAEIMRKKVSELEKKYGKYVIDDISPWLEYSWPGNVRELYSKLEYSYTLGVTPEELGSVEIEKERIPLIREDLPSIKNLVREIEQRIG